MCEWINKWGEENPFFFCFFVGFFCVCFCFFAKTAAHRSSQAQGLNPHHSSDNTGFLTPRAPGNSRGVFILVLEWRVGRRRKAAGFRSWTTVDPLPSCLSRTLLRWLRRQEILSLAGWYPLKGSYYSLYFLFFGWKFKGHHFLLQRKFHKIFHFQP